MSKILHGFSNLNNTYNIFYMSFILFIHPFAPYAGSQQNGRKFRIYSHFQNLKHFLMLFYFHAVIYVSHYIPKYGSAN